jgi:hypothetical protein
VGVQTEDPRLAKPVGVQTEDAHLTKSVETALQLESKVFRSFI